LLLALGLTALGFNLSAGQTSCGPVEGNELLSLTNGIFVLFGLLTGGFGGNAVAARAVQQFLGLLNQSAPSNQDFHDQAVKLGLKPAAKLIKKHLLNRTEGNL